VLIIGVILWFVVVYLGLQLLRSLLHLPQNLRAALERRRSDLARSSFEEGLRLLLEGNWKQAEIELVRRVADHRAPHLNYLAAARAAQRAGAADRRDHYLRLAASESPSDAPAVLLSAARLQRERGDFAEAKATALRLRERGTAQPYVLEVLAESYAALGEWEPLRQLLSEPAGRAALTATRLTELRTRALLALLQQAATEGRLDRLRGLWDTERDLRELPAVRRAYVRGLARLGSDAEATAQINKVLSGEWDAELVSVFADLHPADPITALSTIEEWLQRFGEQPELLRAAGRICVHNRLWGKARSYLDAALRLAPNAGTYLDLAQLSEATQSPDEAARFYREGLELASRPSTAGSPS
jgi:HemY protein